MAKQKEFFKNEWACLKPQNLAFYLRASNIKCLVGICLYVYNLKLAY